MPPGGIRWKPKNDLLTFEEIHRIVRIAARAGVRSIRLTGGEPTLRHGLSDLIAALGAIDGIEDIGLTTNGIVFGGMAGVLRAAGLRRVNLSLDTLRPERFREITRGGDLSRVHHALEQAEVNGYDPIKLNVVAIRGFNDDEFESLAALTRKRPIHVRFIELMAMGCGYAYGRSAAIPIAEIRERIHEAFGLEPADPPMGQGPARYLRIPGALGTIGFISPVTEHFCGSCNRLRLTADGRLKICLLRAEEQNVLPLLRGGAMDSEVRELFLRAIERKDLQGGKAQAPCNFRLMAQIGG